MKTAIMIDGGYYLKRAHAIKGQKSACDRATELELYCHALISHDETRELYRVFYYDCPPSDQVFWNPIEKRNVSLAKTSQYKWMNEFHKELTHKRKFALRMGELLQTQEGYRLKKKSLKELLSGKKTIDQLTTDDLTLDIQQKGVDMKLGIDVASLSYGRFVDQIIMIAGDTDFVPAAKLARRQGIDFILDPMWKTISDSLSLHIDGIESAWPRPKK